MAGTIRALIILLALFAYKSYGQSTYPEVRVTYRYGTDSVVVYPDSIVFKSGGVRSTLINRFKAYADTVRAGVALFAPSLTLSNLTVDASPDSALSVVNGLVKMAAWPATPAAVDSARYLKLFGSAKYLPADSFMLASRPDTNLAKQWFNKPVIFGDSVFVANANDTVNFNFYGTQPAINFVNNAATAILRYDGTALVSTVYMSAVSGFYTASDYGFNANRAGRGLFLNSNANGYVSLFSLKNRKTTMLASGYDSLTGWKADSSSFTGLVSGCKVTADTIFGYTNSNLSIPSYGLTLTGLDTFKWWSGDSVYITNVYFNIKTAGTIAGADTAWIKSKATNDSTARFVIPYGTTYINFAANKAFARDTLCLVIKKGGTTVALMNYVAVINYGTRKGVAW